MARFSKKKYISNIKCVFRFSLKLLPRTFRIVRRVERDMITNANRSSLSLSCQILMKRKCNGQIFEKYSNTKFHKNSFSGSQVFPSGRTDKTKLIVAFRNFVKKPNKAIGINFTDMHDYVCLK